MALRARKVSGAFEKRTPGLSENQTKILVAQVGCKKDWLYCKISATRLVVYLSHRIQRIATLRLLAVVLGCVPLMWSVSGSVIQDHSEHGKSKEPTNPLWSRTHRFLWCTMIRLILDHCSWSRSSQRNGPLVCLNFLSFSFSRVLLVV